MKISVMGLGYVGAVSAACFAEAGHQVVGVDVSPTKVQMLNEKRSPVVEPGLEEIIARNVEAGRLIAISDAEQAVLESDLSFICVGTPSRANGSLDVRYVREVCIELGRAIAKKSTSHVVVARSTMLPGTIRDVVKPALEQGLGGPIEGRIGVAINPEFLREGTAITDFHHPPKTVIGTDDPAVAEIVAELYRNLEAPLIHTAIETAELAKYADNNWHAVKVTFANEIGTICSRLGIDSHEVMDIFVQDTKLNISPYYMKPGFAFGGSCLPKDVRALTYKARSIDADVPMLESVMSANDRQVDRAVDTVRAQGNRKIGLLGLAFKPKTDDLRESPLVELSERLVGKGFDLRIYDENVLLARLTGANKAYLDNMLPHIERLLVSSMEEVLDHGETIIVGHNTPDFRMALERLKPSQVLVDLSRLENRAQCKGRYVGFSW